MSNSQRRDHFRVEYPETESPRLLWDGKEYRILDLSEYGFRFSTRGASMMSEGDTFSASLTFADRETFLVFGEIRRINGTEVGVQLRQPLPYHKIMSEQRRLMQKYPKTGTDPR